MKILGNVLVHRLLKKPSFVYDQPIPVDISYLETAVGFDEVRSAIPVSYTHLDVYKRQI